MLIDAIMSVLIGAFTAILSFLPEYSLPSSIVTAGASLGSSLSTVNGIVPLGTMAACILALLGVKLYLFVWSAVVFIYDRIPFKAT